MHEDPITTEQIAVLSDLLEEPIQDDVLEGFLIMCSRLVDNFGHHRTHELARIFQTHKEEGKTCLKNSLLALTSRFDSYEKFAASYPVSIIPPRPVFPMMRIIGIENISKYVYRVLDSNSKIRDSEELVEDYIVRKGELPLAEPPAFPVLREKPKFVHWCSYVQFHTPQATQEHLQILKIWNNCELRATLSTRDITDHAYLAYNGDHHDPSNKSLGFYGYFFEPITQDHPPLEGGEVQIKVFGAPKVSLLEKWNNAEKKWKVVWLTKEPKQ